MDISLESIFISKYFFNWNDFKIFAQNVWLFIEVLKYLLQKYKSNFVFDFNTQLAFFSYEKMNHQQLTRIISNGPYPESSKCYMKTCL